MSLRSEFQQEDLTLVIVGDAKVGKTTLIHSYVNHEFADKKDLASVVPDVVPLRLPAKDFLGKSNNSTFSTRCNINLIDLPSNNITLRMKQVVHNSNAVIIMSSWDNMSSINRITDHWLCEIVKCCSNPIPIFVFINKCDVCCGDLISTYDIDPSYTNESYRVQKISEISRSHPFIKNVYQISVEQNMEGVLDAMENVITLMLYPLYPLVVTSMDYKYRKYPNSYLSTRYQMQLQQQQYQQHYNSSYYSQSYHHSFITHENQQMIISLEFLTALTRIFHILDRNFDLFLDSWHNSYIAFHEYVYVDYDVNTHFMLPL
ncbi:hypothetical protein RFI_31624 [Reticulomyxa filosa]|uniref:Uncharacterized protein n=1 Tax=Reticulomyxa filosa TaxID=46433 RepID=X6LV18_RETFI|nr:hypothetical protein RFI_31624 [Reticulomyxa filosa]|eukprot:ETO05773.1 hypothetical protein RFI_31624 [Reticulomyxa filosa]